MLSENRILIVLVSVVNQRKLAGAFLTSATKLFHMQPIHLTDQFIGIFRLKNSFHTRKPPKSSIFKANLIILVKTLKNKFLFKTIYQFPCFYLFSGNRNRRTKEGRSDQPTDQASEFALPYLTPILQNIRKKVTQTIPQECSAQWLNSITVLDHNHYSSSLTKFYLEVTFLW